jgi:hypothetical protein
MLLTYGYDLKDGDKIVEAPVQVAEILEPFLKPGAALINSLPFCAVPTFIPAMLAVPHSHFQCGIFPHGSHTLATNQWREWVGS